MSSDPVHPRPSLIGDHTEVDAEHVGTMESMGAKLDITGGQFTATFTRRITWRVQTGTEEGRRGQVLVRPQHFD